MSEYPGGKGVNTVVVAALEQALTGGGTPVEDAQRLCEVHTDVFRAGLERGAHEERMPGHPVHTFQADSRETKKRLCALSFVDTNDRVRYYSDSPHRVFPRSPAIIGREVQNCHPPKSVHIVEEILGAFKAGEKDRADFWIEMGGRFIHISYLAERNDDGEYLGCLEMSMDATDIRALTGQRRLLDW